MPALTIDPGFRGHHRHPFRVRPHVTQRSGRTPSRRVVLRRTLSLTWTRAGSFGLRDPDATVFDLEAEIAHITADGAGLGFPTKRHHRHVR